MTTHRPFGRCACRRRRPRRTSRRRGRPAAEPRSPSTDRPRGAYRVAILLVTVSGQGYVFGEGTKVQKEAFDLHFQLSLLFFPSMLIRYGTFRSGMNYFRCCSDMLLLRGKGSIIRAFCSKLYHQKGTSSPSFFNYICSLRIKDSQASRPHFGIAQMPWA